MPPTVRLAPRPHRRCHSLAWVESSAPALGIGLVVGTMIAAGCANGGGRESGSSAGIGGVTPLLPDDDDDGVGSTDGDSDEQHLDDGDLTPPPEDSDCLDDDGYSFNVIWVANSFEGTVSKIDTVTARELARYRTGPGEESLSPSRTSVNLRGDVAVGNRAGSVIKIAEKLELCVDSDGDGEIRTSGGPDDVLPWGDDECVIWSHEIDFESEPPVHVGGLRAVAWDFDKGTDPDGDVDCYGRPNVWIGWRDVPSDRTIVRKIAGHDGSTIGEAVIENWECHWNHGAYGGAIDPEGDFWVLGTKGTLVQLNNLDLSQRRWDHPDDIELYGLAIDEDGTPWMASWLGHIWKFDRDAEKFVDVHAVPQDSSPRNLRGLAIDLDGHAWVAGNTGCALLRFDTRSETVVDPAIALPDCVEPVGVSIDSEGEVWVVDRKAERAYEVKPDDYATRVVKGLVSPYTYSDMTGAGLGLVVPPIE